MCWIVSIFSICSKILGQLNRSLLESIMHIYYQAKYEYIHIACNLSIAAIMRHYPRPEYQFQKSACVV